MRFLLWIAVLISLVTCEPIPKRSIVPKQPVRALKPRPQATPITEIGNNVKSFSNRNLGEYQIGSYLESKKGRNCWTTDLNILPFSPKVYKYVMDTIIVRWHVSDKSTKYLIKISNVLDETYASIHLDQDALMIRTVYFEENGVLEPGNSAFTFQFDKLTNRNGCDQKLLVFRSEKPEERKRIREAIDELELIDDKVQALIHNGYYVDALSIMELELVRNENEALSDKYWETVNELLTQPAMLGAGER